MLGKPRCKWQDNIKMDLKERYCEVVDFFQIGYREMGGYCE
jgi:hypothetical protein